MNKLALEIKTRLSVLSQMKSISTLKSYWLLWPILASCLEPYAPPETKIALNALVIDGFVNMADNTATVRLSRTTKLADKASSIPEQKAVIKLEEVGNSTFITLPETSTGFYSVSGLNVNTSKKYRLHIKTIYSRNYTSDEIEIKPSPPIDSVYWTADGDGVQIYIATHDPTNKSIYYLWDYVETWQHNSVYNPYWKVKGGRIVVRTPEEKAYICWSTANSSNIFVTSTKKLGLDVVNRFPIIFIPANSLKLTQKYSIIVQQQVLTEAGFEYWQQLQKTTEKIGGLFDPLPSQLTGNIHSDVDDSEPVMGYFSGGTLQKQRIYIDSYKLPRELIMHAYSYGGCEPLPVTGFLSSYEGDMILEITPEITTQNGNCVSCLADGGTTTKPSFWP